MTPTCSCRGPMMWYRTFAVLLWGLTLTTNAIAAEKSVIGNLGYQYHTIEGREARGPEMGALAQWRLWPLVGGPTIIAGSGLKYSMLKYAVEGVDISIKSLTLQLEGGFEFLVTEKITVQTVFAYEIGLNGAVSWSGRGASTKKAMSRYRRHEHEWRGLYPINDEMSGGLGIEWYAGRIEAVDLPQELNYSGWSWRLLYQYKI